MKSTKHPDSSPPCPVLVAWHRVLAIVKAPGKPFPKAGPLPRGEPLTARPRKAGVGVTGTKKRQAPPHAARDPRREVTGLGRGEPGKGKVKAVVTA